MKNFEILEHTTDLKIKAQGKNLAELFKNTALGMFSAACGGEVKRLRRKGRSPTSKIVGQKSKVKKRKIEISAKDSEELLINFLNELIFLSDTYNEIYLDFKFEKVSKNQFKGIAFGQSIPESGFKAEIKAATFHQLKIKKIKLGYQAVVLFDI